MALRATIYKTELHVADNDRGYYGSHALTIALHPSETEERMMVRVLAYALNAHADLAFSKGLSDPDEPDIWRKELTGDIAQWIEIGQPDERRILKACGRAEDVRVYCYASASKLWWDGIANKVERARNLRVFSMDANDAKALAALAQRTMTMHVNVQDGEAFVSTDKGETTVFIQTWR